MDRSKQSYFPSTSSSDQNSLFHPKVAAQPEKFPDEKASFRAKHDELGSAQVFAAEVSDL